MAVATLANYVELAAAVIPLRQQSHLKQKLGPGCRFSPMPLSLGWETIDTSNMNSPLTGLVPDLAITDIRSGATRPVRALWMHSLYQHTIAAQPRGTTVLQLNEVGFTRQFGWYHVMLFTTIFLQFALALYAIICDQQRDGCLIIAGIILQSLHALYDVTYPEWREPRQVEHSAYYALHTKLTTTHILLLSHAPNDRDTIRCQLEDAATPLPRFPSAPRLQRFCCVALRLASWIQKATCILTPANGYTLSLALILGTAVTEFISAYADMLPTFSAASDLEPNPAMLAADESLIGMLTAACQVADAVSCGFVESIIPDRGGNHVDYGWLSRVIAEGAENVEEHPTHPSGKKVLDEARRNPLRKRANLKVRKIFASVLWFGC